MSNALAGACAENFYAKEAVSYSMGDFSIYMDGHLGGKWCISREDVLTLAISRLQCLLDEGRKSLSGQFTKEEVRTLLNCVQAELFSSRTIYRLAISVAEELGVDEVIADGGPVPAIIQKLLKLSLLEQFALADALEQSWYRPEGELTHFDIFEQLGIKFE